MNFVEKDKEFVVSFNELEIDNTLMASKAVEWLKGQKCFQNKKYFCGWQVVENASPFHDKRGYVVEYNLKNKVSKKVSIKSGNNTYYFVIIELNDDDITADFVLNNCCSGRLFFLNNEEQLCALCEKLESDLNENKGSLTDKLISNGLDYLVCINQGHVLSIVHLDDQVAGNSIYGFSLNT